MLNKRIMSFLLVVMMLIQVSSPALANNNSNEIIELSEEEIQILEKEIPSLEVKEMSFEEKYLFYKIVEEEVDKAERYEKEIGNNNFDKELFREEVIKLFNNSEISTYSIRVPIKNNVVAAGINTAIGLLVGGGVSGVQNFIKKKGVSAARKIFTVTIKDRLVAWGATKLGTAVGIITSYVLNYLDFGTRGANWLDRNDRKGKNGYWDIYIF